MTQQTSSFSAVVPVICSCAEMAVPALRFIGDDGIARDLYCSRCGTTLATVEHPEWSDD